MSLISLDIGTSGMRAVIYGKNGHKGKSAYYEYYTGEKSSTLSAAGSYKSLMAPAAKYMFDNDLTTYYHSGQGQRTDEFVAADMGIVREVREVFR